MIKVALTNLGKYNEGELVFEWLALPTDEDEISDVLKSIGIGKEYEEFFISDYETDLDIEIHECTNVYKLNEFAKKLENFNEFELVQIGAIKEITGYSFDVAIDIFEQGQFKFIKCDITSNAGLGGVMVDNGFLDVPERLRKFMDYEAIGKYFSSMGWSIVSDGLIYVY